MRQPLVVLLVLAACMNHGAPELEPVEPPAPAPSAGPIVPDAVAKPAADKQAVDDVDIDDSTRELTAADLVVQLEYTPGLVMVDTRNPFDVYGRVPTFTMYRDGSVIYVGNNERGEHGLFVARRGEATARRTVQHIVDLGFGDIESHEDSCIETPTGMECVSDSSTLVLRVRVGDTVREIRNYGGRAKDHDAQLSAIYDRIELLQRPAPWGTRPFVPLRATLYTRALGTGPDVVGCERVGVTPWDLDASLFEQGYAAEGNAVAVGGDELRSLSRVLGNGVGRYACFVLGERTLRAQIVPWLPGVDHSEAIASEKLRSGDSR